MVIVQQQPEMLDDAMLLQSTGRASLRRFRRYLLLVLLIPALFFPLPFVLVQMPSYEQWASTHWGPMLEYGFDAHPQNADVVIFGDSSAFLGIDPRIVNRELGISSVVLPDTVGSLPVTEDRPLQSFLAHNPTPRLIVFYFSAWDLDFGHLPNVRYFEGEEMMFRHMSRAEIWNFAWHHPTEILEFPFRLYSTFGPKIVISVLHHVRRDQATAQGLGHVDYTEPFPSLNASCKIPNAYVQDTRMQSVQELVRKYSSTTKVMVYIAPVPGCRNSAAVVNRSFAGVDAAAPALMPPASFAGDPYFAHIWPGSVRSASLLFAKILDARLKADHLESIEHKQETGPTSR